MSVAKYVVSIPRHIIAPIITFLAVAGTYAVGNSFFDVGVMAAFGLLGFVMDRYQFPTVPLIIALIIGQALELSLIQSLIVFRGNFFLFFKNPICAVALGLAVLVVVWSLIKMVRRERAVSTSA